MGAGEAGEAGMRSRTRVHPTFDRATEAAHDKGAHITEAHIERANRASSERKGGGQPSPAPAAAFRRLPASSHRLDGSGTERYAIADSIASQR